MGIEGTLPAETVLVNLEQLVVRGLDILRFQVATQGQPAFVKGIVYQRLPVQLDSGVLRHDGRGLVLRNLRFVPFVNVMATIPLVALTLHGYDFISISNFSACGFIVRMPFTIPIPVRCLI